MQSVLRELHSVVVKLIVFKIKAILKILIINIMFVSFWDLTSDETLEDPLSVEDGNLC